MPTTEKPQTGLRTPEQAKAHLEQSGISIAEFARANDLDYATTYQVLTGAKKGRYGEAHRAAVLLGIKAGVAVDRSAGGPQA